MHQYNFRYYSEYVTFSIRCTTRLTAHCLQRIAASMTCTNYFLPSLTIRQLHRTLDEEIRAIKSQKNAVLPVCCLPPEILFNVFYHLLDKPLLLSNSYDTWFSQQHQVCPSILASQVCQHFRLVAHSFPSLWSTIGLPKNKDAFHGQWAHSQSAPLSLYSHEIDPGVLANRLVVDWPRIELLVMRPDGLDSAISSFAHAAQSQPPPPAPLAPLLTTLSLYTNGSFSSSDLQLSNFLSSHAPQLKRLMIFMDTPLRIGLLSQNMVELSLLAPSRPCSDPCPQGIRAGTLQRLPHLQKLSLSGPYFQSLASHIAPGTNLILPRISSLALRGTCHHSVAQFLECLHIPATASVEVGIVCPAHLPATLASVAALALALRRLLAETTDRLISEDLTITVALHLFASATFQLSNSSSFRLHISVVLSNGDALSVLAILLEGIAHEKDAVATPFAWKASFGGLQNLRSITLSPMHDQEDVRAFLAALTPHTLQDVPTSFPALRHLDMGRFACCLKFNCDPDGPLHLMLQRRGECSVQLDSLGLPSCWSIKDEIISIAKEFTTVHYTYQPTLGSCCRPRRPRII